MAKTKLGLLAAISIVIANMIGTGVFTSLGFQLVDIQDYRAILLLWIIGGGLALLGSFCYAELSSSFPKSGGEYHFLTLSMGRTVGFLSGWTSAVLGFAAPIAAAAHAFAQYFTHLLPFTIDPLYISTGIILIISAVHSMSLQTGARFQVVFTIGKIGLLIVFILSALYLSMAGNQAAGTQLLVKGDLMQQVGQSGFWVGLIFVSYAYSGWNASAYMIDEIRDPVRNVPQSIIFGTVLVLILYTSLNFSFLLAAPANELAGKPDVAFIAAENLFSQYGAMIVSSLIAFFLISTISSMILVGPRVIHRIAEDNPELKFLSKQTQQSTPTRAIWLQSIIALVILHASRFEFIVTAIGFILSLFTTLTAASTIILRMKHPNQPRPVRIPLYPLPPLIYIAFTTWIMIYVALEKTTEALFGIVFLLIGLLFLRFALQKKTMKPAVVVTMFCALLASCEQAPRTPAELPEVKKDSALKTTSPVVVDSQLDKRAAAMAGEDSNLFTPDDRKIVKRLNRDWNIHDTSILQSIRRWSAQESFTKSDNENSFVFYPFSGPDLPFVQAFYPDAPTYLLVGLERAGSTESLMLQDQPDYTIFLKNAQRYFYFSSRYGFFRTRDMEKHFLERGVVDIICYYLKKLNCRIDNIHLGSWDPIKMDTTHSINDNADFCHIRFQHPSGKPGEVIYFSKDLSDEGLSKDHSWLNWVVKIQGKRKPVSMAKAASYLMDRADFSIIRNHLLERSDLHIQDDSGIGYNYLKNSGRRFQLYGKYTRTIPLFAERFRADLAEAYKNDSIPKLPFTIGYTAAYGEGNLQIITR
jgi:APA family basic amino acid/polyamine antiporter